MSSDIKFDTRAAELIDQIAAAADSLEQLLNDLLDLFWLESNQEKVIVSGPLSRSFSR